MFEKAVNIFRYWNAHCVKYAVIGGFALTCYGVNRSTDDIDILVSCTSDGLDDFATLLVENKLVTRYERPFPSLGIVYINTLRIDLIPYLTQQEMAAFYNAKYKNLFGTKVRVARLEDILLIKLDISGDEERHELDVQLICRDCSDKLDMAYLRKQATALGMRNKLPIIENLLKRGHKNV